jgi:transcriptional regulator with XRE-family HTH domain
MIQHDTLRAMETFSTKLRNLRQDRHITQRQLGELAGLDPTYISKLEHGADRPGEEAVRKLADALGVDEAELLVLAGHAGVALEREALRDPRVGELLARLPKMDSARVSRMLSAGGITSSPRSVLLVDGDDIESWARRQEAQALLPALVQRLVIATGMGVHTSSFGTGKGIVYPGWDGLVQAEAASLFVPFGTSAWEISVAADPRKKADADFAKRTARPGSVDPGSTTFVFVTGQRFRDKNSWTTLRRRGSPWRDVRVIDADDLAAWLDQAPAVHTWLSVQLGKMPEGVRSLEAAWTEWSQACDPALSPELTLAGRSESVDAIQGLLGQAGVAAIRGDAAQEVIAFVAAVVHTLTPDERLDVLSRAVVCDTEEGWRQLSLVTRPLVLLVPFAANDAALAASRGHTVLIAGGRDLRATTSLDLPRPKRDALKDALTSMFQTLDETDQRRRVDDLATLGRRGLLALRRKLAISPARIVPEWARQRAPELVSLMLAGSWDESLEGDREALETLTGREYADIQSSCTGLAAQSDPPLRRDGSSWILVSKEDMWLLLSDLLTTSDVSRFERVAKATLGSVNPALQLPRSERWLAGTRGLRRPHSELLRKSLAESVLYLATSVPTVGRELGTWNADRVVAGLLGDANQAEDARLWASLNDVLPILAEAAPERFLEGVDRGLTGREPRISGLFNTSDNEGPFAPAPDTTGLLWALETLCWCPEYLPEAASLLARLDRFDQGAGKWTNKPLDSLRRIFLPWHPGTSASLAQRLSALDIIRRRQSATAWSLMIGLLPALHDFATPTHEPMRREWASQSAVTFAELYESADAVAQRLLDDAGGAADRWISLVEAAPSLPPVARDRVLDAVGRVDSLLDGEGCELLGERIRRIVAQHRQADNAVWRLPDPDIERLEQAQKALVSSDLVKGIVWLFSQHPQLPTPLGDWDAYTRELGRLRLAAASRLCSERGLTGLELLASAVEAPTWLGITTAELPLNDSQDAQLVELVRRDEPKRSLGLGFVMGRFASAGWEWMDPTLERIGEAWGPSEIACVLTAVRPARAVWDWLCRLGPAVEDAYWDSVAVRLLDESADIELAARKLLERRRGADTVELLAMHMQRLQHPSSEGLVVDALVRAKDDETLGKRESGMFSWAVARLLDFLDKAEATETSVVASLEFAYLPLLSAADRPAKVLQRELASNPSFFLEVLRLAFRRDDEERRDLSDQDLARARLAYELLDSWQVPPGTTDSGLDGDALRQWVGAAASGAEAEHRKAIGLQQIGRVLRYVATGQDGIWPAEPVRDLLEDMADHDLELGLSIEIHNSRGATWRGLTDGGTQERDLAARYSADSSALKQHGWTRIAGVLARVAQEYEAEARQNDIEADLTQDTF